MNDQQTGNVREGFGSKELERRAETASSSVVAQATAAINARYIMALQRPRDFDNVRAKLLKECGRSSFAEQAIFSLERGDKPGRITGKPGRLEGLTVRFAESVIRLAGNVQVSTRTLFDDEFKRLINVSVTDLETNAIYERDLVVQKTVERSKSIGRIVVAERTNSWGKPVYIVEATDEEMLAKEGAVVSKTFRTLAIRFLPPDIVDECERAIVATMRETVRKDPDAARKRILDSFAGINILPADLKLYLGHDVATCSPSEIEGLRGLYEAISEGEVTWAQVLAERAAPAGDEPAAGAGAQGTGQKASSIVADRVRARAEAVRKTTEGVAPATKATAQPTTVNNPATGPAARVDAVACTVCGKPVAAGAGAKDGAGIKHRYARDCEKPKTVPADEPPPGALESDREPGVD